MAKSKCKDGKCPSKGCDDCVTKYEIKKLKERRAKAILKSKIKPYGAKQNPVYDPFFGRKIYLKNRYIKNQKDKIYYLH